MEKAILDPCMIVKTTSRADPDDQSQILVFPSPGQGHMSPMIQFSKRLASKGVRVTLVTVKYNLVLNAAELHKIFYNLPLN
jgi:hypothetical protein